MKNITVVANVVLLFIWCGLASSHGSAAVGEPAAQKPSTSSAKPSGSPDSIDQLLAPIALYPDALLGNMLLSAANPGKVGALSEWLLSQSSLKGTELQDAARKAGFEDSFVALVVFPDVVNYMAGQMEWTAKLGQAFTADRSAVFASIQRLRAKARAAGKLNSTPQQNVESRTTSSGQEVIVIEPANSQVVYVPQYNPDMVYTQPATSSTVVVQTESSSSDAVAAGLIGFTAGIAMGAAFDNDYYYGPYGWGGGFYMYDDAWDDWYDAREDAREDWQDYREDRFEETGERREDIAEERGDRARTTQEQRTERQQTRQENRPETQAQREQRRSEAQAAAGQRTSTQSATGASQEARGYSRDKSQATGERSGRSSDAFSGYSSGRSQSAASERGQRSRSSSRGSGGRRR
jgi:Protein of unknown function (DUF3300)